MEREQSKSPPPRSRRAFSQAKRLRKDGTPPERILWRHLRNRQLGGLKFRRQHPLGPFIADFFCDEFKLVVEIDGEIHDRTVHRDDARTAWLRSHGIKVLRVSASDVSRDLEAVLLYIRREAGQS